LAAGLIAAPRATTLHHSALAGAPASWGIVIRTGEIIHGRLCNL
jgi:hypothetical protein